MKHKHSMAISYANLYAILGMKLCYNELFDVYEDKNDKIPHFCENLSLS